MVDTKQKPHYINNKEFSQAVVEYVGEANIVKDANALLPEDAKMAPIPKVTDYIAKSFIKISEGLSHRPNFVRYTYREEMVMDAVENCLRAIGNYDITTATRTGNPNAFSYFTQICYFAFIRRITKEKKQQDIKFKYIEKMGVEDFITLGMDGEGMVETMAYVDSLKQRIGIVKENDQKIKSFAKEEKAKEKLELFML